MTADLEIKDLHVSVADQPILKGINLSVNVYNLTKSFPEDERFSLTQQVKRSAISVPSNIAEGSGRNHNKEFIQFLGIANGSTFELITQLILAKRLKLVDEEIIQPIISQLVEVSNMNFSFQKTLKTHTSPLIQNDSSVYLTA